MRILDMIFYWAKVRPDHVAIIQPDTILTFKTLAERVESVSWKVAEFNLDRQKPIAILIQHRVSQFVVCLALMELGFSIVPAYGELLPHLRAAGVSTFIHDGKDAVLPDGKKFLFNDSWFLALDKRKSKTRADLNPRQYSGDLIFFTSGSTGAQKKMIFTADAFLERLYRSNPLIEGNFARTLIIPGLDGTYGFFPSWAILSAGHTVCFAPVGEASLLLISSHRINYIIASPQQALELVALAERGGGYQLDSLKAFRIGGGMVTEDLVRRIQASFCPNVIITYGSTEVGTMAFATYNTIAHVPGAVGIVAPWAQVEIVDQAGNVVAPGVEGQIRARTPTLLERLAVGKRGEDIDLRNAWLYPGDLGRLTEEGILCISGRIDDVLNRGGVSISAADLDETLRSCVGIADAGVCGVMGDTGILQVWAGLVPNRDFDLEAFMRSMQEDEVLKRKLETNIDKVLVVDRIPRTQVGKIKRNELREMLRTVTTEQPA